MTYPFAFFGGNADQILLACAEGRLDDLEAGRITPHLAVFPYPFPPADLDYLADAIFAITRCSEQLGMDQTELQPGLFVSRIMTPQWVESVARLGADKAAVLLDEWVNVYMEHEHHEPEWSDANQTAVLVEFIRLCQVVTEQRLDLVLVWFF